MEVWLDSTQISSVQIGVRLGILSGVTTNPSLIARSERCLERVLEDLLHFQEGPVAVQVVAQDSIEMVQQGQNLYDFSNRLIIKVPVTINGLEAIHLLSRQGIPTMATALFTPHQALMAALAGADYLAPYLGKIEKAGGSPWETLTSITRILNNYHLTTKILGASIYGLEQAAKCAELGIFGITVKETIFEKMIEDHPLTLQSVQEFMEDAKHLQASVLTV
jgi:transaldolase